MKKLIAAAAAMVWAGAAFAGDYHQQGTLKCSECHTMHASRSHGMQNAAVDPGWVNPVPPNEKLLIASGVNATCLACHDALPDVAPDVYNANAGGLKSAPAGTRSAGALSGAGALSNTGGYDHFMGHTVGSALPPPGFTSSWDPSAEGFHCGNCHAIHGSDRFRNLGGSSMMGTQSQRTAGVFATVGPTYNAYPEGGARPARTDTMDVYVTNAAARTYRTDQVKFQIGSNGMNAYCAVCHGDYHGAGNTVALDPLHFVRHPTSGVGFGASTVLPPTTRPSTNLVRPAYNNYDAPTGGQAACLSCHKGHGNLVGFALVMPVAPLGPTADVNLEEGDSTALNGIYPIRNTCTVCHQAY